MAFHSMWYEARGASEPTLILLGFDLTRHDGEASDHLLSRFQKHLSSTVDTRISRSPFAIHATLLQVVACLYDDSIWAFRDLLRGLEKV